MFENLIYEIQSYMNPGRAVSLQKFFQTHKGGYGEGDIFLGVRNPILRIIAKKYKDLCIEDLQYLIASPIHENRFVALVILNTKFNLQLKKQQKTQKKDFFTKNKLIEFYLKNTRYINNRDLVDISAPNILGKFILIGIEQNIMRKNELTKILYKLAKSQNLWEKRISVVSCLTLIKKKHFSDFFEIAKILFKDKHNLIHKSIGWMLREVGKINHQVEYNFLIDNYNKISRLTLRYAIERFHKDIKTELMNLNKK